MNNEVQNLVRKYGMTKVLEQMIAIVSGGKREDYLDKLLSNLEKTLEDYENRYKKA